MLSPPMPWICGSKSVDMGPARISGGLLPPVTVRAFTKWLGEGQGQQGMIRATSCKGCDNPRLSRPGS